MIHALAGGVDRYLSLVSGTMVTMHSTTTHGDWPEPRPIDAIDPADPHAEVRLAARALVALEGAQLTAAWPEVLAQADPHHRSLLQQLVDDLEAWSRYDARQHRLAGERLVDELDHPVPGSTST